MGNKKKRTKEELEDWVEKALENPKTREVDTGPGEVPDILFDEGAEVAFVAADRVVYACKDHVYLLSLRDSKLATVKRDAIEPLPEVEEVLAAQSDVSVLEIMDIREAAEYLRFSKSTLYKMVAGGGVPAAKIRGEWRFKKSKLDAWIEALIDEE